MDLEAIKAHHRRCACGDSCSSLSDADRKLIARLMRDRHASPFEHVVFTFHVRCPIAVAREWQRHRDSYSELSSRYAEMGNDCYVPDAASVRAQVGKAMGYQFEPMEPDAAAAAQTMMQRSYQDSYGKYLALLHAGVAKELARNVLPLGLMTEMWWTVKLRAVFNFLSLRTAPSALLEIRQEAEQVEQHVARIVPVAYAAWVDGGRQSL